MLPPKSAGPDENATQNQGDASLGCFPYFSTTPTMIVLSFFFNLQTQPAYISNPELRQTLKKNTI
jgi:hypothetical protein